jgi:hypothetical protein
LGSLLILSNLVAILSKRSRPFIITDSEHPHLHDNPYFETGDIWVHNDQVIAHISRCSDLGLLRNTQDPSEPLSEAEEAHLSSHGCSTNSTTVILLSSLWFREAFSGTSTTGETIYAQSFISTLNRWGYSYVFGSLGWWNSDMRKSVELWKELKGNIRLVLADKDQVETCWNDVGQKCLKTEDNPGGIEAWRILTFWYWDE